MKGVGSGEFDVRSGSAVARHGGAVLVAGMAMAVAPAGATPRFFASPAQCESAGKLSAGACRTAFANAMAEFAAKAPRYASRRACFKQFGPCMPWPIGTRRFDTFRPQWIGATIDDTSVLPATAPGRMHLDFAPQSLAALSPDATRTAAAPTPSADPAPVIISPDHDPEAAPGPAPRAGSGFTVIDGVLTYPAPARFQPKNLKQP